MDIMDNKKKAACLPRNDGWISEYHIRIKRISLCKCKTGSNRKIHRKQIKHGGNIFRSTIWTMNILKIILIVCEDAKEVDDLHLKCSQSFELKRVRFYRQWRYFSSWSETPSFGGVSGCDASLTPFSVTYMVWLSTEKKCININCLIVHTSFVLKFN